MAVHFLLLVCPYFTHTIRILTHGFLSEWRINFNYFKVVRLPVEFCWGVVCQIEVLIEPNVRQARVTLPTDCIIHNNERRARLWAESRTQSATQHFTPQPWRQWRSSVAVWRPFTRCHHVVLSQVGLVLYVTSKKKEPRYKMNSKSSRIWYHITVT